MPIMTDLDLARAAALFHALSDETRLEVLSMLREGERCVCELTDALDAAQSRLSFHLKVLREAGLVRDRRDGRWIYYTLDRDAFEEAGQLLDGIGTARRRALPVASPPAALRSPSRAPRRGGDCCN